MTLPTLALRNGLLRNKTRAALTILGVAVLTLAFVFLRTIVSTFYYGPAQARSDRLVVRNRVSLTNPLPLSYFEKIKAVPGVTQVTYSNWFNGIYIDKRNFFARFAIDEDSYFKVYDEERIEPGEMAAFKADRTGCLVGDKLAAKYGFKIGDTVKLKGDIYPGDWAFTVRGFVHTQNEFQSGSLFFHWKYLDSSRAAEVQGFVGTYTALVANASQGPAVSQAIDALFASSAYETDTESEQTIILGFITGSKAILGALETISLVLLFIMLLLLGNTLAMALRERTNELAVLRTLGFRPSQLLSLSLQEGVWLSAIGGVLGVCLSFVLIRAFALASGGFLNDKLMLPWIGPGLAVGVGLAASLWPARQASRVDIVSALRRVE